MAIRIVGLLTIVAIAIMVGVAVAFSVAFFGHEVLVLRYGKNLAAIDDTPVMIAAVVASYLAGILAGAVVIVVGWRRWLRSRT